MLQILAALEWDQFSYAEVTPEFVVSRGKVDYSLQISGQSKVFIEVKRGGEDMSPHQDQLLRYSFERGVSLAALTNGLEWWFYLPLREGSWEHESLLQHESRRLNRQSQTYRKLRLLC